MSMSLFVVMLCLLALLVLSIVHAIRVYAGYWSTRPGGKEEREFLETQSDDRLLNTRHDR
jgi:hypothetical protein